MTKAEFLRQLQEGLVNASLEERTAAMQYYTEYLDEAGPEGEAAVLAELGSPQQIASDILATSGTVAAQGFVPPKSDPFKDMPPPPTAPGYQAGPPPQSEAAAPTWAEAEHSTDAGQQAAPAKGGYNPSHNTIAKVILIVLLLILLLPAIGGMGGVLGSLVLVLVCVLFIPVILGVGLAAGGLAAIVFGALVIPATLGSGLVTLGMGVVLLGLGLMCLYGGVRGLAVLLPKAVRGVVGAIGWVFGKVKQLFGGKQHG